MGSLVKVEWKVWLIWNVVLPKEGLLTLPHRFSSGTQPNYRMRLRAYHHYKNNSSTSQVHTMIVLGNTTDFMMFQAFLYGFCRILLADKNFKKPKLGFNFLVLPVLLKYWNTILFLGIPSVLLIKCFFKFP